MAPKDPTNMPDLQIVSVPKLEKRTRRTFKATYKLRIFQEANACKRGSKDGAFAPLIKQLTEAAQEEEMESHITDDVLPNRRDGKTIKILSGGFTPETLRTTCFPLT